MYIEFIIQRSRYQSFLKQDPSDTTTLCNLPLNREVFSWWRTQKTCPANAGQVFVRLVHGSYRL